MQRHGYIFCFPEADYQKSSTVDLSTTDSLDCHSDKLDKHPLQRVQKEGEGYKGTGLKKAESLGRN